MNSKVQIFIPAYNSAKWLPMTLSSLARQTYQDAEVIVSDDQSIDETRRVVAPFESRGFRYFYREKKVGGIFEHWNRCIEDAQGKYIGLFHADDLYEPEILQRQIEAFEQDPELDFIFTGARLIDGKGKDLGPVVIPKELKRPYLSLQNTFECLLKYGNGFLICPSVLFRRQIFERVGLFNPRLKNCADLEMWLRILSKGGKAQLLEQPLIRYRITPSQSSMRYDQQFESESEFFTVLEDYLTQIRVSEDTLSFFSVLKGLDRVHRGLLQLAANGEASRLRDAFKGFQAVVGKSGKKNLGSADRLKLLGAQALLPATQVLPASWCARLSRFCLDQTDPRRGKFISSAIAIKRKFLP